MMAPAYESVDIGSKKDIVAFTQYVLLMGIRTTYQEIISGYLHNRAYMQVGGQSLSPLIVERDVKEYMASLSVSGFLNEYEEDDVKYYVLTRFGRVEIAMCLFNVICKAYAPYNTWGRV